MIRGSCLCGAIRFEADDVLAMHHCHCSKCRKAHGAAFRTGVTVHADRFRLLSGADRIQVYRDRPGGYAAPFCRVCGSNAPLVSDQHPLVYVPAGLLDDDPGVRPAFHIFVASKAPWWEIRDEAQQFEGALPGFEPEPPPA